MGTIVSTQNMNIVEAQKRAGFTSEKRFIGDLAKKNDLLQVAPWYPSSNGIFHKNLKATRLGEGAFTDANGAVPSISASTDEETMQITFYEADSKVAEQVVKAAEDPRKTRDTEDMANSKGFLQGWMSKVVYGTSADDKLGWKGLALRRPSINSTNTFSAGGSSGNQSSLYLIEFGEEGFCFRYPKGAKPGLYSEDRGLHSMPIPVGTGNAWYWVRHYEIAAGIEIMQDKALQRMANISVTASSLPHATFIKMKNYLPNMGKDAVSFCNRTIHSIVETMAYDKSNAAYGIKDIEGFGPIAYFVGIPVLYMESILDTESVIS